LEGLLREAEIPYVQGDATQDETLRLAGVERAKGLVAALNDDKSNVFIVLSARAMNPELRVISRVSQEKNKRKLQKAGANVIISPEEVSGRRMVSEMLHSEVVTLLDEMLRAEEQTGQTLRLEELHVDEIKTPALVERLAAGELYISDIGQRTELMVVAIKRTSTPENNDPYIYTPRGNTQLQPGDILIVIGTPEQRLKLQHEVLSENNLSVWMAKIWS
jgi:voltage-gated potassium channel